MAAFRLEFDANAGIEMKYDPTIRTSREHAASGRSIRSSQWANGYPLKPSYFAIIGHRLHESIFDGDRPRNVDYAGDFTDCCCPVLRRIQNQGNPAPVLRSSAPRCRPSILIPTH